jgi:hypothetical protein
LNETYRKRRELISMPTRKEVYNKIMELQKELHSHKQVQEEYRLHRNFYPNVSAGEKIYDEAKISRAEIRRIEKECEKLSKVMVSLPLEKPKTISKERLEELKSKSKI